MATLDSLKVTLRQSVASPLKQPLSDTQYKDGLDVLLRGSGWTTYQDSIIPQLSQPLTPLLNSCNPRSVLEIGPGPKSVLGHLPNSLRRNIVRYAAFEPNSLFAAALEEWFCSGSKTESSPLPCLQSPPNIHRTPFGVESDVGSGPDDATSHPHDKFDIVLFCHSLYGMSPKHRFIKRALELLFEGGLVVVFHLQGTLHINGLACHRTACFTTGVTCVKNDNDVLDCFTPCIAGFCMQDVAGDRAVRVEWRKVCRTLGCGEEANPEHLFFISPNVMVAFIKHATALPELVVQVPSVTGDKAVKNREACLYGPASIVRPTEVSHIQQCGRWALKHDVGLTVIGGGHSGHYR